MRLKNPIPESRAEEEPEAAVGYLVQGGQNGRESIIFVFSGSMAECQQVFDKLFRETCLCTGPEHQSEERPAKLIIVDARENPEAN